MKFSKWARWMWRRRVQKAGGIVVSGSAAGLRVLLVTNKEGTQWIFPKGRVGAAESLAAAAVRETAEESGVLGEVIGTAGVVRTRERGRPVRTTYYLIEAQTFGASSEGRAVRWFTSSEALAALADVRLQRLWMRVVHEHYSEE